MTAWASGYVSDIDYTHGFYRELAPTQLTFAALCGGQRLKSFEGRLRYCELGCGQGFSMNLLAAANPHIDFFANDFNPAHIAGARALASQAKLGNAHFYEHAFAEFADEESLPAEFDIITLHGILSWVSPSTREDVIRFISRKLRPGGLVFASYNTLPGWAPVLPLRRILFDRASQRSGPITTRIDEALAFAGALDAAGAAYFKQNPSVHKRLEGLGPMSRSYLAHEFFNHDWEPFYFSDVASQLSRAKLVFASSLNFVDTIEEHALTEPQKSILDAEPDPVLREGLRDVLVNEQFRTDLFVKGSIAHTFRSSCGVWLDSRFVLSSPIDNVFENIRGRRGKIELDEKLYRPVVGAFAQGPISIKELLTSGLAQGTSWDNLTQVVKMLVGAGHLQPCLGDEGIDERRENCRKFNRAVCEAAYDGEDMQFLASPVSGGGFFMNRFEQLFLLARSENKPQSEWADFAWGILKPQGYRLTKSGQPLESDADNLGELGVHVERFAATRLPVCETLGISV